MAKTAPVRQKRITIDRFLGVDFANAETEVDTRRSPWAPNMVDVYKRQPHYGVQAARAGKASPLEGDNGPQRNPPRANSTSGESEKK